ncbi:membrane protein implicated in regulation of membrane protease activity [Weissella uvarum]|uniref:hypothetical protein n=1 Tax=Weissella uvarum TaxID=1479233 RepID=UPI001960083F|nr:hypothetical protein [Weissella uvarum]MBM7617741.1 membrane protein implicated in regulation of membrane protease activity [Weissella uvarum]MCM0595880.1 hypothetical protein [Weissella uvarum]
MRGLIYALFCTVTLLSFVGLSMLSKIYNWPVWVSIIVFIVAVILFTYLMSQLVVRLQLAKQKKEQTNHADETQND